MEVQELEGERTLVQHLNTHVNNLTIDRRNVQQNILVQQNKQKDRHDAQLEKPITFNIGNQVLYFNAAQEKSYSVKFQPKWKGPYYIQNIIGNGAFKLATIEGKIIKTPVNGMYLKHYKDRQRWEPIIHV